jgi:biopolymer transport protein ExbB
LQNSSAQFQYNLANKDLDKAISACDKQKGSVGNVMKAGLRKYREMITNTELSTDQKVLNIQKEVEEATALELPMLEKNLVFLSTIASVATLMGLLGTVIGMIRSFASWAKAAAVKRLKNCRKVFPKPYITPPLVSVLQP